MEKPNFLNQLNKASHKISKPPIIRRTPHHHLQEEEEDEVRNYNNNPQHQQQQQQQQQQQLNQPPVYNINKIDFREVVQKLTGSPAHHDRFSTPPPPVVPPVCSPKPQSSRLQRIRPPPLAHLSTRPPPIPPLNNNFSLQSFTNPNIFNNNGRSPLSPLPPFPTVHAAAESPISAYMKYLRGSMSIPNGGDSSRWMQQQQPQQGGGLHSPNSGQFVLPNSPLAFGRISSPKSPYPLLSPSLLFSPTNGHLGLPQFHH